MGELYDRALAFATEKHKGKTRWDKKTSYITHPIAVAELVRERGLPEWIQAAALLHDTIEDTDTLPGDLDRLFGTEITVAVQHLSREKGPEWKEPYLDYIRRVQLNKASTAIKIADLDHNMSDLKKGSMLEKYKLAKYILEMGQPSFPPMDWVTYLNAAWWAFNYHTKKLGAALDLSDEELGKLFGRLHDALNKESSRG